MDNGQSLRAEWRDQDGKSMLVRYRDNKVLARVYKDNFLFDDLWNYAGDLYVGLNNAKRAAEKELQTSPQAKG